MDVYDESGETFVGVNTLNSSSDESGEGAYDGELIGDPQLVSLPDSEDLNPNPTHAYTRAGQYIARLRVSGEGKWSPVAEAEVNVIDGSIDGVACKRREAKS